MMFRARLARRPLLHLEELEPRQLLSGAAPTAVEQLFLEALNDARANPAGYGASIGLNLSGVAPSQPLAFDPSLIAAALGHSQDMNARNYFAHNTPEGIDPGQRITAAGFPWNSWGESIAAGSVYATPADALRALIIDTGVPDLGHRRHLLAIDSIFSGLNVYLGNVIGEFVGELSLNLFFILSGVVDREGIGILLVEHDMALVRAVCSYIYVLDFGKLIYEGTAADVSTCMQGTTIVVTSISAAK